MLNIVVCIKQVPMVSELPWNPKTGTLKRELAEGTSSQGATAQDSRARKYDQLLLLASAPGLNFSATPFMQ